MLDELVKTIEILKTRIKDHRDHIRNYERRTRNTLIDPLLCSLGWDVSDPSIVTIEPKTDDGWADYGLLDDRGRTVIFVEAKGLAKDVDIKQTMKYALAENYQYQKQNKAKVDYCVSTNGDIWELYDLSAQETVLETSIVSHETAKCALQLLGLWRRSMADRVHSKAVQPVVTIDPSPDPPPPDPPRPDPRLGPGWVALNGSFETKGKRAPKAIKFPDGSKTVTDSWLSIAIATASWLHQAGHLTRKNCQVYSWETAKAKSDRYILSGDGRHPDSSEFRRPRHIADGIILNHIGNPRRAIQRSIRMLDHFGQDPAQMLLQLG